MEDNRATEQLVNKLITTSSQLFMFHGEVAMQLFLNDEFELPSIVEICVERKRLSDIIKVISSDYKLIYIDKMNQPISSDEIALSKITQVDVAFNENVIMHIYIYDVIKNDWIFRLDSDIRLPKKTIYFHSLKWNIDYLKPEIVLMYDLMQQQKYLHFSNYKKVIDALSYYQFFTLKFVVGEQRIKDAIQKTINN
ncbi:hypothetical protein [Staphylococcus simiae]|uniref:Uncharacterized protein n=1 Tax=Staphylococcus simiae CCM 7213 = CCUG 51256 TaxID=911238 RepID=G5JGH4_9STAP|nr:hypothetical protein [Staphylococcus simiae]EHJ08711.1 hypothetical protein SS7213T_02703 [Staphylococcus simiae CCM 7213 = CCUG 51256]PNZ09452.1 hypothetical protein CD113_12040 [Staphylococcus simiae]SNV70354.1 Uncharacterised protein [Staphylococcus simiae]